MVMGRSNNCQVVRWRSWSDDSQVKVMVRWQSGKGQILSWAWHERTWDLYLSQFNLELPSSVAICLLSAGDAQAGRCCQRRVKFKTTRDTYHPGTLWHRRGVSQWEDSAENCSQSEERRARGNIWCQTLKWWFMSGINLVKLHLITRSRVTFFSERNAK